MSEKSFPIRLEHRPRRIAFLVDLQQEAVGEVLSGILRFNLDSWGGRLAVYSYWYFDQSTWLAEADTTET